MIQLSFEKFWAYVSNYISRRIGVGLDDLADVDLWDYWTAEPQTKEAWQTAVAEAAQHAMSEQDCVDAELMALFNIE
jgi:hypothetical protein